MKIRNVGNVTVVVLCGKKFIDHTVIEKLGLELYRLVEEKHQITLVLDFSDVEFLTSEAIGKLISLYGKLKNRSGTLILCGIQPQILEVFEICKLDKVFDIVDNQTAAIESLSKG